LIIPRMHPLIRTSLALICFWQLSIYSFAGPLFVKPVKSRFITENKILKLDSFLSSAISPATMEKENGIQNIETSQASSRICSCQVLNLESSNYEHHSVVLLSEKTNDGTSAAYSAAKNRLIREKRLLKKMFYDKVKVIAEFQGAGSCKSMFRSLQSTNRDLKLYEILNAD
jgi:hypothetical protein